MSKQVVDGMTVYSNFLDAPDGGQWNLLIRASGSLSLYVTYPGASYHAVAFDSTDPFVEGHLGNAKSVLDALQPMREVVELLTAAISKAEEVAS